MAEAVKQKVKGKKGLSIWIIILSVIVIVYGLSFIIPAGAFQRAGKIAIPGTYAVINKIYLSPLKVIIGIGENSYKVFGPLFIAILVMGGLMGIVNSTGGIDRLMTYFIKKFKNKALLIIPAIIFLMGFFGALGSFINTAILFLPIALSVANQLKADRVFAAGLLMLGSYTGFMSSPVNPFTTMMAQQIAGIPVCSGAGLRTIVTIINLAVVSLYLIWYAQKCRKDITVWENDFAGADDVVAPDDNISIPFREWLILIIFFCAFIIFAVGAPLFKMNILQLASIQLPIALICGAIAGYDIDTTMGHFVKGAQKMVGIIVFMVFASTMSVIFNESKILDTIVYYLSIPLSSLSHEIAAVGMFIVTALLNICIPSGSAKAALMMPVFAPLADVLGVSRQMSVLALQFGDGLTNLFTPMSVAVFACLAGAKVPVLKWYKFLLPLYLVLFIILIIAIFVGVAIGYN